LVACRHLVTIRLIQENRPLENLRPLLVRHFHHRFPADKRNSSASINCVSPRTGRSSTGYASLSYRSRSHPRRPTALLENQSISSGCPKKNTIALAIICIVIRWESEAVRFEWS
jgi:hypothetical protein